jgi:phosphonate transport system substrate-binding protein
MRDLVKSLTWLLCLCLLLSRSAILQAETLTLGRVAVDPTKYPKLLKPLLEYVVGKSQNVGVTGGSVVRIATIEEAARLLTAKKLDWVSTGIAAALIYQEHNGAEILLRTWRDGTPFYRTIFFTRQDSSLKSLNDLKGRRIAFQDPQSTSAYFIPLAILRASGLHVIQLTSLKEKLSNAEVGYMFAGTELNISTWVQRGLTEAGAYSDQNWNDPGYNPEIIKEDLKIFYQHKPLPRTVEVFRKDLDPRIKAKIKEILVHADQDPAAQSALKSYSNTKKFDEFKGEAQEGLEEARRMMKFVGHEIN